MTRRRSRLASTAPGNRLGELAIGRDNNLNLLRMVAAVMVLFSHCYHLTGNSFGEPLLRRLGWPDAATLGVGVFFGISGFLIAQSLAREPSLWQYAKNRALRILPGLAVASLFTVLVGWMATSVSTAAYWSDPETLAFLFGTPVLRLKETLPGVFDGLPFGRAVNGSLWTIPVEVLCYVAMAAAATSGVLRRRLAFTVFAVAIATAALHYPDGVQSLLPYRVPATVTLLVGTFFTGALLYAYRDLVPASAWIAIALIVAAAIAYGTATFAYLVFWGMPYVALVLAYHPRLQVRAYLRLGDYSYGTYLFAFPVQQFIVWRLGVRDPMALLASSLCATLPLAVLSWHLVEKRALRLKDRHPRRLDVPAHRPGAHP